MSVYLAEGNVADAIHQRDVFTDHLRRELGLEPSPRPTCPRSEGPPAWRGPRRDAARDAAVTITAP